MQLPPQMIPYLYGIIHSEKRVVTTVLEYFARRSHDYLTRLLKKRYRWRDFFLEQINDLSNGYLVVDDTDINKKFSKKILGTRWLFSHKDHSYFNGYSLLLLLWVTNRGTRIPVGFKVYCHNAGKTRIDQTIELLKFAIERLKLQPRYVLFDSFFAAKKILHYCDRNDIPFVGQVQSNRLLNGKQLKHILPDKSDWTRSGRLKSGLLVKITKHGRKYFVSNNMKLSGKRIRTIYKNRWNIETVFRFVKDLGIERCQMRSLDSQVNHFWSCLVLYFLFQNIAQKTGLTAEAIRQDIILHRNPHKFTLFNTIFCDFA